MIKGLVLSSLLAFSIAEAAPVSSSAKAPKTKMKAPVESSWNSPRQAPLSLTPVLGANYMSVIHIKELSTSPDTGMTFGAMVDMQSPANKDLFFQTGVLYNQFGSKVGDIELENGSRARGVRFNLTYLNFAAIAKYNIVSTNQNSVFVKAGLLPGVIVAKELRGNVDGVTFSRSGVPELKQYDLPFILGGGARIPFQKEYGLMLEAAWVRSIFDTFGNSNAKNDGFIASAGINIAL